MLAYCPDLVLKRLRTVSLITRPKLQNIPVRRNPIPKIDAERTSTSGHRIDDRTVGTGGVRPPKFLRDIAFLQNDFCAVDH